MMGKKTILFWFRQDLRLLDNPGLFAASEQGTVMPIYILENDTLGDYKMGGASKWWLYHSLSKLNQSLENTLNVYIGKAEEVILKLVDEFDIDAVYWNRCYEPYRVQSDATLKSNLKSKKIECKSFNASLLWEPWEILKQDKTPYKVYTAFYRNGCLQAAPPRKPISLPKKLTLKKDKTNKDSINSLDLLSPIHWYEKMEAIWEIGEKAAHKKLLEFLDTGLIHYKESRNYPNRQNVSRLSPHLHFGEISPNQIWHTVKTHAVFQRKIAEEDRECFLSEIGWREFSYYLLYHFPNLPNRNFQSKFDRFPWQKNKQFLTAWQKGKTGYPIIDAGMRELWQTGYMHNRVRMIVASFLVKNLNIHWQHGAAWFWDCLLDADLANNSASWQWVAGSGADAAPYFRIFNPITQGEKFDLEGNYTRHYVPELTKMPNKYLFKPWQAPASILEDAGVILGKTYPKPIVDLTTTRERALAAYRSLSQG